MENTVGIPTPSSVLPQPSQGPSQARGVAREREREQQKSRHPLSRRSVKSCRKGRDKKGRQNNDVSSLQPLPSSFRIHTRFCSMLLWGFSENCTTLICGLKNTPSSLIDPNHWFFLGDRLRADISNQKWIKKKKRMKCLPNCWKGESVRGFLWWWWLFLELQTMNKCPGNYGCHPQMKENPDKALTAPPPLGWRPVVEHGIASCWKAFAKAHSQSPC